MKLPEDNVLRIYSGLKAEVDTDTAESMAMEKPVAVRLAGNVIRSFAEHLIHTAAERDWSMAKTPMRSRTQDLHELGWLLVAAKHYAARDYRLGQFKHAYSKLSKQYHVDGTTLGLVDDEIESGKREMVRYEHRVRNWLYTHADVLDPDEVETWFARLSGNDTWSRHFINGIMGEVALLKLLQKQPVVTSAAFTHVNEDVRGADLIVTFRNGQSLAVDVKTIFGTIDETNRFIRLGRQLDLPDGRTVERTQFGVPRGSIGGGFRLEEWHIAEQLDLLEQAAGIERTVRGKK